MSTLGNTQGNAVVDFEAANKVLQMFESEYTEQLGDRKASSIIRFCKERSDGFYYQEIEALCKMVEYAIADLKKGVVEMTAAIQKLCETSTHYNKFKLQLINRPLLYNTHAEEKIILNEEVTESLRYSAIIFLRNFSDEGIDTILQAEKNFEKAKMQGYEPSPLQKLLNEGSKNLRAINKSDVIEDIIFTMQYYQKNYEYLLPLLDLISNCIMFKDLAQKFCNFGILKDIIYVIFDCDDFRSYIVKSCFEIIWNAIEAVGISSIQLFAAEDIITQLKRVFEDLMRNGYKLEDKCLRNELLILINYLLSDEKALQYFDERSTMPNVSSPTTFIDTLLVYATVDEIEFYNDKILTNNHRAFYSTTSEDLEFKKLIWSGLLTAIQSGNQSILETIKDSAFIYSLLLYIDPLNDSYAVNRWSNPQLKEIQLHCLTILSSVIIYMKEDFAEKNGLFYLTKFLTNQDDPEKREKCLRVFNNASLFDEPYKLKITDEGVMDNLIEFLQNENDNPLDIKELCFSIISNLCINCNKNKKLFRQKGGVDMIVNALKDPNLGISARYALYAVSILDCLWNSILGNRKSESVFLDNEGLFVLLEFLEVCDDMHKKMALSCLSYLIENPKATPYFCDWNSGKTMINATQLLIKIYNKEDNRFQVKYDDGIIVNKNRPLNPMTAPKKKQDEFQLLMEEKKVVNEFENGTQGNNQTSKRGQSAKGFARLKEALLAADSESEAGTEAYLVRKIKEKVEQYDLRAIIFAILYRTGFDKNELLPDEKQKIEVIQMYPHFKMGEIWSDIQFELEEEVKFTFCKSLTSDYTYENNTQGIKPTSDDMHWMRTAIEEFEEQVLNCINTQSLISREHKKSQEEELNKFYDIIRSNKVHK
ncbi:hypothetical protein TTHERM_00691650 (macronuclear) [Tetrahymena thermophila SB210]|uniref:Cilia- and flagella-associated protein 69 ARM repeats domain-containing protein n=1 Tax=Tetrahymena thermophila (strain SB210) TaxID=312017 RepID=I7M670_TETTS|nr:hypothetical protein TTHERM_00691650 [Tetrahymena thermophila SB210]EAR84467.2 hypothetical protein TTHERM_00691650 [Tetrahymena thermophila SB210]|eukprot:XP_001032130.2 hypothetical protein TTHERM_00691650 [Tetrahymena thermophila SB210]